MTSMTKEAFEEQVSNGQIFTVEFTKRTDGSHRVMNCRTGVKKGVKGVGLKFDPKAKDLLVVYDMQKYVEGQENKGAFRMVNLSDLIALRMDGKSYTWDAVGRKFDQVA